MTRSITILKKRAGVLDPDDLIVNCHHEIKILRRVTNTTSDKDRYQAWIQFQGPVELAGMVALVNERDLLTIELSKEEDDHASD